MAKDPICGMDVNVNDALKKGLVAEKDKKVYYFCSDHCKTQFEGKKFLGGQGVSVLLSLLLVVIAIGVSFAGYMLPFMGVVFLLLASLKLIDLKGFAEMFVQYDLVAKKSRAYAFVYPFIELVLGLSFLFKFQTMPAALITIIVMSVGAIGVGKNLFSKNKLRCACLGAKIKVPLTGFTFVEDIIMAVMGIIILVMP